MAQPVWGTNAGSLGTYPTGQRMSIKLIALPSAPATDIRFRLISGQLPTGTLNDPVVISPDGYITGTPENIVLETTYTFTIRANDELSNFGDRTFSISMVGSNSPSLKLGKQELINVTDSVYVDLDIPYTNPVSSTNVFFTISSGSLPPGLVLTEAGKIIGYPKPPTLVNGSPTKTTYTFTIQLNSDLGIDVQTYTITVRNQRLTQPKNTRKPVILNYKPLVYPIPKTDSFFDYYLVDGNTIADINAGEYFAFKVLGKDFDNTKVVYNFSGLPPGLRGDVDTGWITGVPQTSEQSLLKYDLAVTVSKDGNRSIMSEKQNFTLRVASNIKQDVEWTTASDLGTLYNGTISNLYVQATSALPLQYKIIGELPPNLTFLPNGQITGRVAYQPTNRMLNAGDKTVYEFEVTAFCPTFPLLRNTRTFKLTVLQYYDVPVETIYIKAASSLKGKKVINSLLSDDSLIPYSSLFRPEDPFFGKATGVSFVHAYGVPTSSVEEYTAAMTKNHFTHNVLLNSFKTAIARDDNNNIIYEVVYCDIHDGEVTSKGTSTPQEIIWDRNIILNKGPWNINNSTIHISFNDYNTNLSPGEVRYLNPSSTVNMRNRVTSALGQDTDVNLLPRWMTSQQLDGNTIGFIPAWVVCYTLPGHSQTVIDNINNNWGHKLNEIDFTIDRYIVDKSATYNWNSYLSVPTWSELPSASPTPSPIETRDMVVLFPRTTILPKDIDY